LYYYLIYIYLNRCIVYPDDIGLRKKNKAED